MSQFTQPPSIGPTEIKKRAREISKLAGSIANIAGLAAANPEALTAAEFSTLNTIALQVTAKTTSLAYLMAGNQKPKTGEVADGGTTKLVETNHQ